MIEDYSQFLVSTAQLLIALQFVIGLKQYEINEKISNFYKALIVFLIIAIIGFALWGLVSIVSQTI